MQVILNIGLAIPGSSEFLTVSHVVRTIASSTVLPSTVVVQHLEVRESTTEPTAVVVLRAAENFDAAGAIARLAVELGQEAIAFTVDGIGALVGPQAERWGAFNPEFFLLPTVEVPAKAVMP